MASLYPTLEDMKVDQIQQAQIRAAQQVYNGAPAANGNSYPALASSHPVVLDATLAQVYPSLMDDYMGLHLEPPSGPIVPSQYTPANQQIAIHGTGSSGQQMVAPITGNDVGLRRAQVTHGIREVILCKDGKGKVGLRVRAVNKGLFVQFVAKDSPAALGGLRVGDQILQMDGQNVAGLSDDKSMELLRKASPHRIVLVVRDRPFERTITLHKDSTGHCGFMFKNGKITAIAKETSAARNGLLIDHQILEMNGQNVIGMKDPEITKLMDQVPQVVTLTIMPSYVYDHMMKEMSSNLVKKLMDHSVPDV